ncbi:T9SS type A sorting domain-containing protein, partial [bacterium]|nr:T9SS type A sorting domain-containing protein [bacterium]
GTLKWKYQFEGSIQSSPVIGSDGTIYVGSTKDLCLYAFALETSGTRILTIISPNGGEKLAANKTFAIIWEASNVKLITIEYSVNNGQNWMGVATQVNAEAGKYDWMVPETLSDNCLVRLINEADTSMIARSSAVFEILLPTAGIDPDASSAYTDPPDLYAGEKTTVVITLNDKDGNPVLGIPVTDIVVKVLGSNGTAEKVDLSFDKAQSDATGIIGVTFSSTVPGIKEIVVTVRGIELTTRPSVEFYEPFITVWYPNEFEEWQAGGEYDIWWESGGVKSVDIWFTPDSGIHWNVIAENVDASLGYFTWSIPANLDVPQCYISVGDSGNDQLYDNSDQAIAIVPSGQEAMISLSSPQGGENWAAGSSHVIRWNSSGVSNVKLEYTTDNGTNWTVIIASLPASAGTYAWTVPDTPSAQCLVRVSDAENADQNDASNAPFTIFRVTGEKSIELVSPVGGELWEAGKIYPIVWNAVNVTEVSIVYSINLGETWDIVKLRADANTGSFKWLIPDTVESDKCLIFVADSDSTEIGAMNQQPFTIFKGGQAPVVQVLAPNGGETVSADQPYEVRWNAVNVSRVRIDFSPNNGQTWTMLANDIAADTGRHTINFPFNRSNECLIKVSSMTDDTITDKSDGFFTLTFVSSITVEAPAAGDKWTVRSEQPIRWTLKGIKNVAIDYSTDGGTTWKEIVTDIDATLKVYRWTIPSDVSGTCKVRISDTSARDITAVSGVFSIVAGNFISVTSPSAGQTWSSGAQYEINWKFEGISKIKIELSTDGGNTWQEIAASVSASDGYYVWKVPEAESADCLIRLSDTSNSALSAQSDLFTIVKPVIQITHSPIAEAEENRELTFTAQVTSNTEIKEVMLYYDETGDRVFSSHLAMTSSGNNNAFSVTMTEGIFTALGMEYYITARDAEDKETRTPAGEGFYSITAVVKDIKTENPVTGGSVQTAYRMVSIPLELVKTSIVDQLSGKLPKGETGVDWRIYRYQPGSETPQEYPNTEGFAPGRAFWVIAKEKYELESPAGKTVTTAEPFKIELKSGWNDIANPWMFDISWSNIENPSGAELSVLYTYEGHWTDPTKPPTVMEPWKGYSVKNLSNRTVIIRLQPTRQSAGKAVVDANPSDWVLSIAAAAGQAVDSANHLGVRQDASAGWDRYDHVEPPAVGEYVSVLFPHRDWLQYPSDYTVDFRPPGETVMWDFDVKTNISRERVSVRLEGVDTLPEGCTIAITDRDSGKPVALNGDSFEFLSEKGITAHHYTLTVASGVRQERQDTAIQPERYVTATCYPNPFNPQTTIRYTLSTAGRVHITIFNSVGQRVRDYDMGFMGPGVHELVFDTAGLTSGIYLYRVDSGYASVTEKMLFMK